MKLLKGYFIFSLSMLLVLGSMVPVVAQGEKKDDLIGHWTFENGVELEDLTGHFGDIDLLDAEVKDGKLHIGNSQLPQAKAWGLCEAYTEGSLHKLNGFLQ